jgi:C4-dicarboxylate transporter DctM subunit
MVYCAIPLGSALMCFRFLQVLVGFVRTGELPHHDHGHVEGIEAEPLTAAGNEDKVFRMDDDLHPRVDEDAAAKRGDDARTREAAHERFHHLRLLAGLMLTGMPVSISLGLTVLSFLFLFTEVPIESVALKLFTGIEKFEIMAIPFFILAGNFLTHGGVAKRMIRFATSLVGPLVRRPGPGRRGGLRAVRGGLGLQPGHGGGDRLHPAAGHGQGGLPVRFGAGVVAPARRRWAS